MLELSYEMNNLIRVIIQTYLKTFNNAAMVDDGELTDKMYKGSQELKQLYDKIPPLSDYHQHVQPKYDDGTIKLQFKINREEAHLLLSTMDCVKLGQAITFGDKYAVGLWNNLEDSLDKIWLNVSDMSDTDLIKQKYQQMIAQAKENKNKKHKD